MKKDDLERYQEKITNLVKQNLKNLRKYHNLTQEQMAKKIGISHIHYQRLENADSPHVPSLKLLGRISNDFGLHISYFFTEKDQKIVDEHGNIIPVSKLSGNGIVALRAMEQLSDLDREEIRSYIMFKLYQRREQEKLKENDNKK